MLFSGDPPRDAWPWIYAGWIVPVINLRGPRRILADVHEDTAPGTRLPRVVNWWWGLWLVGRLGNVGGDVPRLHGGRPSRIRSDWRSSDRPRPAGLDAHARADRQRRRWETALHRSGARLRITSMCSGSVQRTVDLRLSDSPSSAARSRSAAVRWSSAIGRGARPAGSRQTALAAPAALGTCPTHP